MAGDDRPPRGHRRDPRRRPSGDDVAAILGGSTDVGLVRVAYQREDHDTVLQTLADRISPRILHAPARLDPTARELEESFTGTRQSFDLALDWRLSAGFRADVLHRLPDIGYGHTASCAAVAALAGNPEAVRAVGQRTLLELEVAPIPPTSPPRQSSTWPSSEAGSPSSGQ